MNKRLQNLRDEAELLGQLHVSTIHDPRANDLAKVVRDLIDLLLEDEDRYESTRGSEEPRR